MRTRVKICGITRREDGVAAPRSGADAIGLIFWEGTPRRVSAPQARAIAAALPPFVSIVGLFVDPTPEEVRAVLDTVPLDSLQFHGNEPAELCRSFARPYIKAIAVAPGIDLLQCAALYPDACALVFDAHQPGGMPGGTGTTFEWSSLPDALTQPVIVSGGLNPDNVAAAIAALRPWAVDVSSGVEQLDEHNRPQRGIKDPARITHFMQKVALADAS
jgi:phosphoribosylanthranilate isomerase